ncbi:MAG TPA: hypothetical protein VFZ62_02940, partial [Candidatus Saccharimonadales bacterium]
SVSFALTDIEAKICTDFQAPVILQPAGNVETDDASVHVSGIAEPTMSVSIIRNNVNVGATTAAGDGTYGMNVPLLAGDNVFSAVTENDCNTVKRSTNVVVHRVVETPEPGEPDEDEPFVPDEIPGPIQLQLSTLSPLNSSMIQEPDSSGYQKPIIILPKTGEKIASGSVWVSGRAQPRSIVTLYLNGKSVAYVIVSEKGTFGILAALQPGTNTLQVRSQIEGWAATSNTVTVTSIGANETDVKDTPEVDNSFVTEIILPVLLTATIIVGALYGLQFVRWGKR